MSALKSQKILIKKFLENSEIVVPISDKILSDYDGQVVKLQTRETDSDEKLAQLKYSLCFKTFQLTEAQKLHNQVCSNIKKYSDTLYDIKYAVACALQVYFFTLIYQNYNNSYLRLFFYHFRLKKLRQKFHL